MADNSDALPTRNTLCVSQGEGEKFLRRLPGAGIVGDGGVDLFALHYFFQVLALVFFVSANQKVIILTALVCTINFANDESFGVVNHDVVTTEE